MLCAAYHLGNTGPSYHWILLGNYEEDWWRRIDQGVSRKFRKRRCRENEMRKAVESAHIITQELQIKSKDAVTISGRTIDKFWADFAQHLNTLERIAFHAYGQRERELLEFQETLIKNT